MINDYTPPRTNNDAWGTIRGFVYQTHVTVRDWIQLKDMDSAIELERGEDVDRIQSDESSPRLLVQVKYRQENLTLRSSSTIEAIANYFEHKLKNPDVNLRFEFFSNTKAGKEQSTSMPDNQPAIVVWELIRLGEYPDDGTDVEALDVIRKFLSDAEEPKERFKAKGESRAAWEAFQDVITNDDDHNTKLLSLFHHFSWNLEQDNIERVGKENQQKLIDLGLAEDQTDAELKYHRLFYHVFDLLAHDGIKKLQLSTLHAQLALPSLSEDEQARLEQIAKLQVTANSIEQLARINPIYEDIESLFVPPAEFEVICDVLDREHLVIIVGEPHMGKTFTAVRLLSLYHADDYEVTLTLGRTGDEYGEATISERHRLSNTLNRDENAYSKPKQITYIEDPFGSTAQDFSYGFDRLDLVALQTRLKAQEDAHPAKVVVTLRRSIYELLRDRGVSLEQNVVTLDSQHSYPIVQRREILQKYVSLHEPKWEQEIAQVAKIESAVSEQFFAPHNIALLVERTRTHDIVEDSAIEDAKEIVTSLANEFANTPRLNQLVFVATYVNNLQPNVRRMPQLTLIGKGAYDTFLFLADVLGFAEEEADRTFLQVMENWESIFTSINLQERKSQYRRFVGIVLKHPSFAEAIEVFLNREPPLFEQLAGHITSIINDDESGDKGLKLLHVLFRFPNILRQGIINRFQRIFETAENQIDFIAVILSNYHSLPPELRDCIRQVDFSNNRDAWLLTMRAAWPNPHLGGDDSATLWRIALSNGVIFPPDYLTNHIPFQRFFMGFSSVPDDIQETIYQHLESKNQRSWYCLIADMLRSYKYLPNDLKEWVQTIVREGNELVAYQIALTLIGEYEELPDDTQEEIFAALLHSSSWLKRAYLIHRLVTNQKLKVKHRLAISRVVLNDSDRRVRSAALTGSLPYINPRYDEYLQETSYQPVDGDLPIIAIKLIRSPEIDNEFITLLVLGHMNEEWSKNKYASEFSDRIREISQRGTEEIQAANLYLQENCSDTEMLDLLSPVSSDDVSEAALQSVESIIDGIGKIEFGPYH